MASGRSAGLSGWGQGAALAGVLTYAAVAWVWGAGRLDIMHSMEAARALAARTMLRTGDFLIPRRAGRPYLVKPPLFYWAVAGASAPTGRVSPRTVRLPSALSAMAAIAVVFLAARAALGVRAALLSCLAIATMPMVFGGATTGRVNMLLALSVALSILAAFYLLEGGRWAWLHALVCGAGLAMGIMTKWHVGPLFFLPAVTLYMGFRAGGGGFLASRKAQAVYLGLAGACLWAAMATSKMWSGDLVLYVVPVVMLVVFALRGPRPRGWLWPWVVAAGTTVVLALIWPALAANQMGLGTLWRVIKNECWTLRTSEVTTTNYGPPWYYFAAVPFATLPYSLVLPLAFWPGYSSAEDRRGRMILLARCWLVGSIVLFTLCSPARKLRYILPVFPAVALLAGDVLSRAAAGKLRPWMARYVRAVAGGLVYALCLAPVALVVGWLAAGFAVSAWVVAAGVIAAVGAALGLWVHRRFKAPWGALLAFALVFMALKLVYHFDLSERKNAKSSPRRACELIRSMVPEGEPLYAAGRLGGGELFYLDPKVGGIERALGKRGHLFVCVDAATARKPSLPGRARWREVGRAKLPGEEGGLVLLEAQMPTAAPAKAGRAPRP